jgi:hypothetical protein
VLADAYDEVVIVDRDKLVGVKGVRRFYPQSHQANGPRREPDGGARFPALHARHARAAAGAARTRRQAGRGRPAPHPHREELRRSRLRPAGHGFRAAAGIVHTHFQAQFMLALYRSGHPGQALEVYHEISTSRDHLRVDPSNRPRELHRAILAGDTIIDDPRFVIDNWWSTVAC